MDEIDFIVENNQTICVASSTNSIVYRFQANEPYELLQTISVESSMGKGIFFFWKFFIHFRFIFKSIHTINLLYL